MKSRFGHRSPKFHCITLRTHSSPNKLPFEKYKKKVNKPLCKLCNCGVRRKQITKYKGETSCSRTHYSIFFLFVPHKKIELYNTRQHSSFVVTQCFWLLSILLEELQLMSIPFFIDNFF